jgi:aerobic-type carbon monoxide dehydrogenase small subunit (CoxS/CutS family)
MKLGLRKVQAISVVNAAIILTIQETGGKIIAKNSRIALGAVAPTIVRASQAESYLEECELSDHSIQVAAELAASVARPIDDIRGTAEYRAEMIKVITTRILTAIRDGQVDGWMPERPVMLWGNRKGNSQASFSKFWESRKVGSPETPILTRVNGREYSLTGANHKTLLRMLREDLGLTGTKEGCAEGECGACTVYLDGAAVMSCLVPAPRAHGSEIITIEGLAQNGKLHPVQKAFIEEGAVQCGYCTPGMIMSGAKVLEERGQPEHWEVQQAIAGNLCRCTGYYKIITSIEKAGFIAAHDLEEIPLERTPEEMSSRSKGSLR